MSNLFYRNPRLLVLTVSLVLVAGLSSYVVLPRMEDPLLTERAANVNTFFPGADAERVESLVTEKLEEELREVDEIKEMRSSSRAGVSTIAIELRDDIYKVDAVWSRIRNKLDDATPELPQGASDPEFEQLDIKAYALIVALRWTADSDPSYAILRRLAENLEDELKALSGTEKVETFGDPDEEITVEISQQQLASLGLTSAEIARQIRASDAKVAAGQLRSDRGDLLLEVDGELETIARIEEIPIQFGSDGQFVQLSDVASVRKGIVDPPTSLAIIEGERGIALGVLVRSDQRIDHWSQTVTAKLSEFESQLPRGVEMSTVFEQNRYVETRLLGLLFNLFLGGVAVVGVIWALMGWRSALIVGSALPLAALMVMTGLRFLGIPVHQMSVTGLIIALGLLIDNAIVIVDEVTEKLRRGVSPGEAVGSSVSHLAVPLFGSTLTTALAFGPIALMPGPAGEFVGSIAVSVILAIASSFVLAMTVVPAITAMASGSIGRAGEDGSRRRTWWREGFSHPKLSALYARSLDVVFRRPYLGLALGIALPLVGFVQARLLPEQFFPPADRDQIQVELELGAHASLSETLAVTEAIRQQALKHEGVEQVHWFLGESAPTFYYNVIPRRKNTPRYAQALVQLREAKGAREIIHQLQDDLNKVVPDARVLVRQLEQGPPFDAPVEVRLFGPDLQRLRELGDEVRAILVSTPDVIHTRGELSEAVPKIVLGVDEEEARLAGLDHLSIAAQLDATLEGAVGGSVLEATEELPIRVRVAGNQRAKLSRIASLDLLPNGIGKSNDYQGVPLSALADISLEPELTAIPRFNGRRMNEVQAFITAGVLPAEVLTRFEDLLATSGFSLPPGYSLQYGGEAAKRDEAIGNLMASVSVLLVLMVATLVLSFGSFRIASIVGSVAFLSVGLGLGALWLFGYPFGFMAIVGTMGLIGVAINDAIVVLAALREDPEARAGDRGAVQEVVIRSTRHIVATSFTTMAGFTPLVLAGGGFWPPLATAIAGGVGGATILALYFVPSAYLLAMCKGGCPVVSALPRSEAAEVELPATGHLKSA